MGISGKKNGLTFRDKEVTFKNYFPDFAAMKLFNYIYNWIVFHKHGIAYESFPVINGRILVAKFADGGMIKIARNVVINSSFESNPVGGSRTVFLIKGKDAVIEIGEETGMSNALIAAMTCIRIGKDVSLGAGCKIFDTDFHSLNLEERKADTHTKSSPVTIKDGAFIGADSIILKGVTVGERSVVGAGSVVTKSIPDKEIWGGNPAKFLKKL